MKPVEQFDRYTLISPEVRQNVRAQFEASGVIFEMHEETEVIEGTTLYILAVKRLSPTLKQQLGGRY
jgi:hypothetical protein